MYLCVCQYSAVCEQQLLQALADMATQVNTSDQTVRGLVERTHACRGARGVELACRAALAWWIACRSTPARGRCAAFCCTQSLHEPFILLLDGLSVTDKHMPQHMSVT